MPSWPVHIAIARRLDKKLKLGDDFIIGNVIPDVPNGYVFSNVSNHFSHGFTHYNTNKEHSIPNSNIDVFLKDYKDKLDNPILMGYLAHLLTDKFFNEYTYKYHMTVCNDKRAVILNDGRVSLNFEPWRVKQFDFYWFGEFLIYNKKLGDKVSLSDGCFKRTKILPFSLSSSDLFVTLDKINEFVCGRGSDKDSYKMFTKDELLKVYDDCFFYICDFLDKLKG